MNKAYSYSLIADYFIALSNESQSPITNLKLQKLVYYAQAWHLAILKKALINEDFQSWAHGPVIPQLYNDYRSNGWKPIYREDLTPSKFPAIKNQFPDEVQKLLQ